MSKNVSCKVLQVAWPGANWEIIVSLLDKGLLPNLNKLVANGVIGKLLSVRPNNASSVWSTAATGKFPHKHGIINELEPTLDKNIPYRLSTTSSRLTPAIWNILEKNTKRSLVINWPVTNPAEAINGVVVTPEFIRFSNLYSHPDKLISGLVSPAALQKELADLRLHPNEITGMDLCTFVPKLLEHDQVSDGRLSALAQYVAETATTHAIATELVETQDWDYACIYYSGFKKIANDFANFRAPKTEIVSMGDYELYQHVVDGNYVFHDMMLGRLMDIAGEQVKIILVSDEGVHAGNKRNIVKQEEQKELIEPGVLIVAGEGVQKDKLIYGARITDLVPTTLHFLNIPNTDSFDGRVLTELFLNKADDSIEVPKSIATEQAVTAFDKSSLEKYLHFTTKVDAHNTINLSTPDLEGLQNREFLFNFVESLMGANKEGEAISILKLLSKLDPTESKYQYQLMNCYISINEPQLAISSVDEMFSFKKLYAAEAFKAWKTLDEKLPEHITDKEIAWKERLWKKSRVNLSGMAFLQALTRFTAKEYETALSYAQKAQVELVNNPSTLLNIRAECLRSLGRVEETLSIYQEMLSIDEEDFNAYLGLSRAHYDMSNFKEAAVQASNSIGKRYFNPYAHYVYAGSVFKCGDPESAARALKEAIVQDPLLIGAYKRLILLYSGVLNNPELVKYYKKKFSKVKIQQTSKENLRKYKYDKDYSSLYLLNL